ncbi:protein phosphatase [Favolaschia claudopus]|uniref:Protein phosphatase n=1 Tax=Favolaschia claudopus TaxID=2862362 RepID=A0AAV9ZU38_9AGAR
MVLILPTRTAARSRVARRLFSTPTPPPTPYSFHIGMLSRPKAVATKECGEGLFLPRRRMKNKSGVSFGVADGGVDPALFSQALMFHAHRYSRSAWAGEPEVDPTLDYAEREEVEAYGGVLREKLVDAGSSTACIITLNSSNGLLRSANLGDSGFSIIRDGSILYSQPVQSHFFNCPKQLTKLPPPTGKRFTRACVDSPREAETYKTQLCNGGYNRCLCATDGLSDNVFPHEMGGKYALQIHFWASRTLLSVQSMADRLVIYARECMAAKSRVSPFEPRQGMFFPGDWGCSVTVIVALVRETEA